MTAPSKATGKMVDAYFARLCQCMTEDPGDGFGERVVEHSGSCPLHPMSDAYVAMLRPSQFPCDGTMTIDGEEVRGTQFVNGGVRVAMLRADGTFRYFVTSGRRKYLCLITPKEG